MFDYHSAFAVTQPPNLWLVIVTPISFLQLSVNRILGQFSLSYIPPSFPAQAPGLAGFRLGSGRDTGRRWEGRRQGDTRVFLLLPLCVGQLLQHRLCLWGSSFHWTGLPRFWATPSLPFVSLAYRWQWFPTVAKPFTISSGAQQLHGLCNQFPAFNSFCSKYLKWFLFPDWTLVDTLLQKRSFSFVFYGVFFFPVMQPQKLV